MSCFLLDTHTFIWLNEVTIDLIKQAIAKLKKLPASEQNAMVE